MMPIISTAAKCKDCHSCIRACPTKAIKMQNEQANIVEERCILCGNCIRSCSQNAKSATNDVPFVAAMLVSGRPVVASIAPSFPAAFPQFSVATLYTILRSLGFAAVEETASTVRDVAQQYARETDERVRSGGSLISSCCPSIVNLIEIYYPELIPNLSHSYSPMVQHARQIKARITDAYVVFIGPCIAKKQEAAKLSGGPDAVITFAQLAEWLDQNQVEVTPRPVDTPGTTSQRERTYPLQRGIIHAVQQFDKYQEPELLSVNGIDHCMQLFSDMRAGQLQPLFIEAMACDGGCIGGPGMPNKLSVATRRTQVINYARQAETKIPSTANGQVNTQQHVGATAPTLVLAAPNATQRAQLAGQVATSARRYQNRQFSQIMPTEDEIRSVLARTGKLSPADETNCGGCGYPTCREKAIAVCQGLAEPEMCIPYMRARSESMSQVVVETTHNGVIVVDKDMAIQEFNPAAAKMFNRHGKRTKKQQLHALIDPRLFQRVWETQEPIIDEYVEYLQYDLKTQQTIYPLLDYNLVIGIITDITAEEEKLEVDYLLTEQTLEKTAIVIKQQMQVAHDIAGLLGESTAETKSALLELAELVKKGSHR